MKNLGLMPYWYVQKRNRIKNCIIDAALTASIILNSMIAINIFENYNRYLNIVKDEYNSKNKLNAMNKIILIKKRELQNIQSYEHIFFNQLKGKCLFDSIEIKKDCMTINLNGQDNKEILDQVKKLKEIKSVDIVEMQLDSSQDDENSLKVVLELK
jgi:uncharacterized membrane protein YhiD involved in acid resistance